MTIRRTKASGGQGSSTSPDIRMQLVLFTVWLAVPGCGTAVCPEDPADIASWMELYDVPGASIAVINDFELDYVEVFGGQEQDDR